MSITWKRYKNILPLAVLAVLLGVAAAIFWVPKSSSTQNPQTSGDPGASAGSEEKFAYLAGASGNTCGLQATGISPGSRIQGSCCAPMDLHTYKEQIESLKAYSHISVIPPDPYDVSAEQAWELLDFQQELDLNEGQQEVYRQAAELSEEGGPCCCKCWHWDAYEGLAKYLISNQGWDAQQIADLWDMSSACGGTGHLHDG